MLVPITVYRVLRAGARFKPNWANIRPMAGSVNSQRL